MNSTDLSDLTDEERAHGLAGLTPRWRTILEARLAGQTFTKIAHDQGVTPSRVREIAIWAARRVRWAARNPEPKDTPREYWLAMGLPTRAANCLHNEGIKTLDELAQVDLDDLMRIPNFGKKSLAAISELLAKHGYNDPLTILRERADLLLKEARKIVASRTRDARYAKDTLAGWNDKTPIVQHTLAGIRRGIELAQK